MRAKSSPNKVIIGVGLRHAHFSEALAKSAAVDFVEVHSENFFADGGALHQILKDISQMYSISLHSTAMGLASNSGIPEHYLAKLEVLINMINPFLISDHASFAWGNIMDKPVHAGDLLPFVYNQNSLEVMTRHVDQIQQRFGKRLLVENLSAYITLPGSTMSEKEFLIALSERTNCGLLVDLNNILINEHNIQREVEDKSFVLEKAKLWLDGFSKNSIGEFHLAGFSKPSKNGIAVDDHSQPVSEECWTLYKHALTEFGAIPTLIEWDNQLPTWETLIAQADKARNIANEVLSHG